MDLSSALLVEVCVFLLVSPGMTQPRKWNICKTRVYLESILSWCPVSYAWILSRGQLLSLPFDFNFLSFLSFFAIFSHLSFPLYLVLPISLISSPLPLWWILEPTCNYPVSTTIWLLSEIMLLSAEWPDWAIAGWWHLDSLLFSAVSNF